MKKHLLILSFLVLAFVYAQDIKKPRPDSVIKAIPYGIHGNSLYTIGGKLQNANDIRERLLSYPPSAVEYNLAMKNINNVKWSIVLLGASGITGGAATVAFAKSRTTYTLPPVNYNPVGGYSFNSSSNGFIAHEHSKTGAYILTGAAVGFLTATIITWVNAATHGVKHSQNAIAFYNQQFQ
jgi:hypothetical protein